MAKPITPAEAKKIKESRFPDFVIEAVNELLISSGGYVRLLQGEVVNAIIDKMIANGDTRETEALRNEIYAQGWLDFEPLYRKSGWKVEYDKPGYNESYEAFYVFSSGR